MESLLRISLNKAARFSGVSCLESFKSLGTVASGSQYAAAVVIVEMKMST